MWRIVQYLMKLWRDLYSLQMILVTDTVDVKID